MSTPAAEIGVFLPLSTVYPDMRADEHGLVALLKSLSRDDVLFTCARINAVISGFGTLSDTDRQRVACARWCPPSTAAKINGFVDAHGGADKVRVFFRGQLLELIGHAAKHCDLLAGDGETCADPSVRERIFQAALIASELWGKRIYGQRLRLDGGVEAAQRRALGAFRKGIEDSNTASHPAIALARGWLLFTEYMPRRMPDFATRFQTCTGLSLEDYYRCVGSLMMYTFAVPPTGEPTFGKDTVGATTALPDALRAFVALESQTSDQLGKQVGAGYWEGGYKPLRQKPILTNVHGSAIVLDPDCFMDKLTVGPLFHVVARAEKGKANEIFGAFGNAFEDYAADLLRGMYNGNDGDSRRFFPNMPGKTADGQVFEVDAAVRNGDTVDLFEIKAAWIREERVLDESGATFMSQLRLKYGMDEDNAETGERAKGAAQLARIAGALGSGEWSGADNELADVRRIYPILLVHDARLGSPGLGDFLDREFKSHLKGNVPAGLIRPLTIMTIQDLENLSGSVATIELQEFLNDYDRACPDRIRSLYQFMATSAYAQRVTPSERLMQLSQDLAARIQSDLFPKRRTPVDTTLPGLSDVKAVANESGTATFVDLDGGTRHVRYDFGPEGPHCTLEIRVDDGSMASFKPWSTTDTTAWYASAINVVTQRKRIACGIYAVVRDLLKRRGQRIAPSDMLSDDGVKLWRHIDPSIKMVPRPDQPGSFWPEAVQLA